MVLLSVAGAPAPPAAQSATGFARSEVTRSEVTSPAVTPIYAIQGRGAVSPLHEQRVTTMGLVSGVTVDGFFMQDPGGDGDPATSDGLFVYTWQPPDVRPGECIQVVDGLVTEFYGKTELTRVAALVPATGCGAALTAVDLPPARLGISPTLELEPLEGMLVRLPELSGTVHGPTRAYDEGEKELALLSASFSSLLRPGHFMHDQPDRLALLTYVNNRLGADLPEAAFGQTVSGPPGLLAVLDYAFGKVQVLPLPGALLTVTGHAAPPLPAAPAAAHEYTVCSANLGGLGRGQEQLADADAYDAALKQRAHLLAGKLQGCTIIAVQETGTPQDAAALAAELAAAHALDYAVTAFPGPASTDADFPLTNSVLTRRDRVQILDAFVSQGCSTLDYGVDDPGACDTGGFPLFDRPPLWVHLAIQGAWQEGVTTLWVVDNHWKSKAGDEAVNVVRRMAQAEHVAAQVQALLLRDPAAQVVVAGDLNDTYGSPVIDALAAGVEPPLLHPFAYLTPLDRYTYIYNGAAQVLDHLLLSANLEQQVAGVTIMHLNADFPSGSGDVHGSDHDPVLLRLRPDGAATAGGNLSFANITVQAVSGAGVRMAATATDAMGEYRLWGLAPGALTLHFTAPPGVWLAPSTLVWEAASGYHPVPAPHVHHRTALAAAVLAVITPNLALRPLAQTHAAAP